MPVLTRTIAAALLVLALAACGQSPDDSEETAAPSGPSSAPGGGADDRDALAIQFAQCMRENGVDYPDPQRGPGGVEVVTVPDTEPEVLEAAEEACQEYRPAGGAGGGDVPDVTAEQMESMRKHAQCIRENGVPDFPDPNAQGVVESVPLGDPDALQQAMQACLHLRPEGEGGL